MSWILMPGSLQGKWELLAGMRGMFLLWSDCFFWYTARSKSANPGFAVMELQLIQSKADIENPETIIEAEVH
jgi:hypothetical protein